MNNDLDTAREAEIVAQDLIRLAARLRDRSAQASASTEPALPAREAGSRKWRDAGETYLPLAQRIYRARRQRAEFWPAELFGEPVWDILLDLYIRACEGRDVSVTSACVASSVPSSTALRWLNLLESNGLVDRHDAPHDSRVHYVRLTMDGTRRMQQFLRQIEGDHRGKTEPFLVRAR
jgi:DNA-binding MarR family transcriptional regulator